MKKRFWIPIIAVFVLAVFTFPIPSGGSQVSGQTIFASGTGICS